MVNLPDNSYKLSQSISLQDNYQKDQETNNLMQLLNDSTIEVATLE